MSTSASFVGQTRSLPMSFWLACVMYGLERIAYYAVRVVAPLYLYMMDEGEGLGLSRSDKGTLYVVWAVVVFGTPLLSSIWADKRGYRRAIFFGAILGVVGYGILALIHQVVGAVGADTKAMLGFWMFAVGIVFAGAGTGILRPVCVGTIAKVAPETAMTLAWGTFYFLVNLAAFGGPILSGMLREDFGFAGVALFSVFVVCAIGLLGWLTFREPIEPSSGHQGFVKTAFNTAVALLTDSRYLVPIACVAVVSTMTGYAGFGMTQYVEDWIAPAGITRWLRSFVGLSSEGVGASNLYMMHVFSMPGLVLVVPVAYWVSKTDRIKGVLIGAIMAFASLVLMGFTTTETSLAGVLLVSGLATSVWMPPMESYVAMLAPAEEKATYMAYYGLLSRGIGWALGAAAGWFASWLAPDRTTLARERLGGSEDVPNEEVMAKLAESLGVSQEEAARALWEQHSPWMVWVVFSLVAVVGLAGLLWFYRTKYRNSPA